MSGFFPHRFSPARALSPHVWSTPERERYLAELVAEHHKIFPFVPILPNCNRLLNQEIARVTAIVSNQGFGDHDIMQHGTPSPMASPSPISNIGGPGLGGWGGPYPEKLCYPSVMTMNRQVPPPSPNSYIVKKLLRLEIPVDSYPNNYNIVGRLLGPRGNSLKRVEASTDCHVLIRGKGSVKDPEKEEKLKGQPGYEHLDDPLHILIEAELPANVIDARMKQALEIIEELLKPVDESHDFYKHQQLHELAMLNSNLREDSPHPSGAAAPFENGQKRAKTDW